MKKSHIMYYIIAFVISFFIWRSESAAEERINNTLNILIIIPEEATGNDIEKYYYYLSTFLKQQGHNVDFLYVDEKNKNNNKEKKALYHSMNSLSLPAWTDVPIINQTNVARSFEIYRFLNNKPYDVIFYSDYNGLGFYVTEAKRQGYAFDKTLLIGTMHRPMEWVWDMSNNVDSNIENYITAHIAEKSLTHANILLTHSRYSFDLFLKKGWTYPKDTNVIPAPYLAKTRSGDNTEKSVSINEIIYIGNLDFHNGYDIFSKMLRAAYVKNPTFFDNMTITFIGEGSIDEFKAFNPELATKVNHIKTFDEAYIDRYIQDPNRLVIYTSRADLLNYTQEKLIYNKVNFIGCKNGSFEEKIETEDIDCVLTPALNIRSLADKLCTVLEQKKLSHIRPRYKVTEINEFWEKFNTDIIARVKAIKTTEEIIDNSMPLVSVCMAHYNRPDQLMDALKSLEQQTYKNFEVLIMDDGSSEETRARLKQDVEPYLKEKGWRIFYQKNQYPDVARNNLVLHAKGEWLMFMDDDNIALKDEISRFIRIAKKTKADIVLTNYLIANKNKFEFDMLKLTFGNALMPTIIGDNYLGDTNLLINKKSLEKLGGWHELYGLVCSDQKLLIDAVKKGIKVEVSIEPTFIYNQVGQAHIMNNVGNTTHFQHNTVSQSYEQMLPHELRHLPFLAYSLHQKAERSKIEYVSAKEVILYRIKVRLKQLIDSIKSIFK